MSSLKDFSEQHIPLINQEMIEFLEDITTEKTLLDAMNYSVIAGGKRIRPLLVLATLTFFGEDIQKRHYQVAAALEMIHTYSLIHDDLPAMDNDDLRRGQPTNHKVYGEGIAILAGDGLLTEALHLVASSELEVNDKVFVLKELTKAAGTGGMIAGQVADIEGEQRSLTLEELQNVHRRKTGALIEFAIHSGTVLSGQSTEVTAYMQLFAQHFGVAFQIKDDLLDVLGNEKELGKKTGMDEVLNKSTYTSLLGVEGAKKALQNCYESAMQALAKAKTLSNNQVENTLLEQLITTLMK